MKIALLLFMLTLTVLCQEDSNADSMQNVSLLFDDDMNLDNLGSNGFLQRNENNSAEEDIPGYINSSVGFNSPSKNSNSFRFSQAKPKDSDPSLQPWFYNAGNPPKDSEIIRKEVLHKGKRTLNFETGKYPQYFMDLRVDK